MQEADNSNSSGAMVSASSSASEHCLTEREMQLSGNDMERIAYGYVIPVFVLLGTFGNAVVLVILLSPPMRCRSRSFCFLAIVDILFLLLILPHSFANYDIFAHNYYFRQIYLRTKVHLVACSNWISACAIWLVLIICMERLLGVRYPLYVKEYSTTSNKRCAFATLAIIVFLTGILTIYTHCNYHTMMRTFCNGTQPHAFFIAVDSEIWPRNRSNPNPIWLQRFARWSAHIHAMFVVFIPTLIIVVANVALLVTLKQRSNMFLMFNDSTKSNDMLISQARIEQKITYSVCAIVTCFTITQAPSALVPTTIGYLAFGGPMWKHNLQILTNCMVVIGKSLNFALFCLSSNTFRQRLVEVFKQNWSCRSIRQRKLTTQTAFTRLNGGGGGGGSSSVGRHTALMTLVEVSEESSKGSSKGTLLTTTHCTKHPITKTVARRSLPSLHIAADHVRRKYMTTSNRRRRRGQRRRATSIASDDC